MRRTKSNVEIKPADINKTIEENWIHKKWRPMMGWVYMVTCITDFILFPVLWAIFQAYMDIKPIEVWDPLTLEGAGLFHLAMGAVLGVTAYGRTKEKMVRREPEYD